eukprot:scaffold3955_cov26-Tisochrysis_lutea.AAC.3
MRTSALVRQSSSLCKAGGTPVAWAIASASASTVTPSSKPDGTQTIRAGLNSSSPPVAAVAAGGLHSRTRV